MIQHLLQHPCGALHFATSLLALFSGALVLLRPKGTLSHRRIGYLYISAMLATNISAFAIYELYGRFGPFHLLALLSLISVIAGLVPAWRRRTGWQNQHARLVMGSYIGLCAAAVAETSVRVFSFPFTTTVITASTLVIVIGVVWMHRHLNRRFPASAMH